MQEKRSSFLIQWYKLKEINMLRIIKVHMFKFKSMSFSTVVKLSNTVFE